MPAYQPRRFFVKGIGLHGKQKEIGEMRLCILHITEPLMSQVIISPLNIILGVQFILLGQGCQVTGSQFFGDMENRHQGIGKGFMFQQAGILQQINQKGTFLCQKQHESCQDSETAAAVQLR